MSRTVLQIENLTISSVRRRRHTVLLRDVSLQVGAGEIRALVGESGAGKSMIMRTVSGVAPTSMIVGAGKISLFNQDWLTMPEAVRRSHLGADIAVIPQDPLTALNPVLTIGHQMNQLFKLHQRPGWTTRSEQIMHWLNAVQIRDPERVVGQYPHQLSGGMRQRVLIAMAFGCEPKLILADEPTTALDVTVQREILSLLKRLQQQHDTAILFITHDLGIVARLCDTATVLHSGMVIEQATIGQIFSGADGYVASDYTHALLQATPRYDRPAEALQPVHASVTEALQAQATAFDKAFAREHNLRLDD